MPWGVRLRMIPFTPNLPTKQRNRLSPLYRLAPFVGSDNISCRCFVGDREMPWQILDAARQKRTSNLYPPMEIVSNIGQWMLL